MFDFSILIGQSACAGKTGKSFSYKVIFKESSDLQIHLYRDKDHVGRLKFFPLLII